MDNTVESNMKHVVDLKQYRRALTFALEQLTSEQRHSILTQSHGQVFWDKMVSATLNVESELETNLILDTLDKELDRNIARDKTRESVCQSIVDKFFNSYLQHHPEFITSEPITADFIVQNHKWRTYGKNGDQPGKDVKLFDCDTDHLQAILDTQKQILPVTRNVIELILWDREHAEAKVV